VGADYTEALLRTARRHYGGRVPLVRLDAQTLPFKPRSFDLVLLYEAIYYLASPDGFVDEAARVLRKNGQLLICSVNCEWREFNPSPFSTSYLSAGELSTLLGRHGFSVEVYGAAPVAARSVWENAVNVMKRIAVGLGLIPKTMRGKARLKRLVYGRLSSLPAEIDIGETCEENAGIVPLRAAGPVRGYKILYAIGTLT